MEAGMSAKLKRKCSWASRGHAKSDICMFLFLCKHFRVSAQNVKAKSNPIFKYILSTKYWCFYISVGPCGTYWCTTGCFERHFSLSKMDGNHYNDIFEFQKTTNWNHEFSLRSLINHFKGFPQQTECNRELVAAI